MKFLQVEAILDHKIEDDVKYFLVRWKGYDSDVDSWEPRFALAGSKALMAKYLEEVCGKLNLFINENIKLFLSIASRSSGVAQKK